MAGPNKCKYPGCVMGLDASSGLAQHTMDHSIERPFKCAVEDCNTVVNTRSSLHSHARHVHDKKTFPVRSRREAVSTGGLQWQSTFVAGTAKCGVSGHDNSPSVLTVKDAAQPTALDPPGAEDDPFAFPPNYFHQGPSQMDLAFNNSSPNTKVFLDSLDTSDEALEVSRRELEEMTAGEHLFAIASAPPQQVGHLEQPHPDERTIVPPVMVSLDTSLLAQPIIVTVSATPRFPQAGHAEKSRQPVHQSYTMDEGGSVNAVIQTPAFTQVVRCPVCREACLDEDDRNFHLQYFHGE